MRACRASPRCLKSSRCAWSNLLKHRPTVRRALRPSYLAMQQYHKNEANVLAHLLTTPLGIFSAAALLNKATGTAWTSPVIIAIYLATLANKVRPGKQL